MKHCDNCNKDFDTLETRCPICGGDLQGTDGADEVVSLMDLLGLL